MPETASITPSLNGEVWLKSIWFPSQNRVIDVADYEDVDFEARSAAFPVEGRSLPTGSAEFHGGRNHVLVVGTEDATEAGELDRVIRAGRVFFIHVPTVASADCEGNLLLPGSMYVLIGQPRKHRVANVSQYHNYSLPLTEVQPPGPDVVGATMTVGQLVALHGTVEQVWAAYPDIRAIWDSIGSLEDLVV